VKIIFDATILELPHTGIAKSTLCLYKACYEIDSNLNFIGVFQNKIFSPLPDFINLIKVKTFFKKNWKAKAFAKLSKELSPDVIHFPCNGDIPNKYNNSLVIMTLNDVLTLEMDGVTAEEKSKYKLRIQEDIDKADSVVTISEYSKKQILKNFKCQEPPVVINCANTVMAKKQAITYKKNDYFIYVGGYSSRKGIDDIVEAFLYLAEQNILRDKLIFVGIKQRFSTEGNKFNLLTQEAVEKGILIEKGYVDEEELGSLLAKAKGLIYPSKFEGFGLPVLEAMQMGCPVVTTRCTSLPEICGEAAIYVEPVAMKQIADAVIKLQDKDVRGNFIQRGLKQAKQYSWERSAHKFLKVIYDKLGEDK